MDFRVAVSNVDASPSLIPVKKYCDITGLEVWLSPFHSLGTSDKVVTDGLSFFSFLVQASYTEPKSGLRYHSPEIYRQINVMPPHVVQEYLALRGAQVVLK